MTNYSTISRTLKAVTITGLCYGWFIPVGFVGNVLSEIYPTKDLTEQWEIAGHDDGTAMSFDDLVSDEVHTNKVVVDDSVPQPKEVDSSSKSTQSTPLPAATPTPNQDITEASTESLEPKSMGTKLTMVKRNTQFRRNPIQKNGTSTKQSKGRKCKNTAPSTDIVQLSKNKYQLSKKLVRKYRHNWKAAQKLARLSWYSKDQQRKGIRIRGIGCTSPVRHSGLRAGDVVLAVNGKSLTTEKELLSVYGRLLIWKDVRLSILRNGKPMSIDYSIRK